MNSIRRLKDKYEEGIKKLKKEQKRQEPEYLKKWKIILIILGSLAIIVIMFSGLYFVKTNNSIPVMISPCVSAIACVMVMIVMEVLQYNYENGWDRKIADSQYNERINTLKKWKKAHKSNNPKKNSYKKLILRLYCLKWMIWVTIVLGIILIGVTIGLILLYSIFKFDDNYPLIMMALLVPIMSAYLLWIANFLEKQPYNRRKKVAITDADWKRVEFLKNLLKKEKICFDDTAKIQVLIDELIRMKDEGMSILKFITQSMAIIWVPIAVVFFDHFTETLEIEWQKMFFILITALIILIIMFVLMLRDMIQERMNKRYDALISDLRILQITKEEKENQ